MHIHFLETGIGFFRPFHSPFPFLLPLTSFTPLSNIFMAGFEQIKICWGQCYLNTLKLTYQKGLFVNGSTVCGEELNDYLRNANECVNIIHWRGPVDAPEFYLIVYQCAGNAFFWEKV